MKYFTTVFAVIVITFLFYKIEVKEKTIENLIEKLEQNNHQIDSLKHEIDTQAHSNIQNIICNNPGLINNYMT